MWPGFVGVCSTEVKIIGILISLGPSELSVSKESPHFPGVHMERFHYINI